MTILNGARGVCIALTALAFSAAIAVPQAQAGVTFEVDKRVGGDLFADTGKTVVSFNNTNRRFNAGGFDLTSDGPLGDFIAFCLDIATTFSTPSDYKMTDTPFGNGQGLLSSTQIGLIQNLYDAVYDTLSSNTEWGGFQTALWEIAEEDPANTLNAALWGDDFYLDYGAATASKANQFLAAAAGYNGPQKYRLIFLESQDTSDPVGRDSQNLVTVAAVPLPAAGILMLAALGGGAAAYRRRKTV